jgi:hypothetical protein
MLKDLSALQIAAYGSAVSIVIAAFVAGLVSLITTMTTAWRTLAGKVNSIEGHVNSEKTASEGRERAKDMEIALLREIIADKKASAGLLAQAAAIRTREGTEK